MATGSSTEELRVLCVDDEPMYISTLADKLRLADDRFSLATANNVPEAMAKLDQMAVDCVVCDYHMPGRDGVDFAQSVADLEDPPPVILLTGKEIEEVRERVVGEPVADVLFKSSETVYDDLAAAVVAATGSS